MCKDSCTEALLMVQGPAAAGPACSWHADLPDRVPHLDWHPTMRHAWEALHCSTDQVLLEKLIPGPDSTPLPKACSPHQAGRLGGLAARANAVSGTGTAFMKAYKRPVSPSRPKRRGTCCTKSDAAADDAAMPAAAACKETRSAFAMNACFSGPQQQQGSWYDHSQANQHAAARCPASLTASLSMPWSEACSMPLTAPQRGTGADCIA